MKFRSLFYVNGALLLTLAASMLIPALVDFQANSTDWKAFLCALIVTGLTGCLLMLVNKHEKVSFSLKETFLLTVSSWLSIAAFSALPFALAELDLDYTRAFFESMSGLTATGSTAITGLDNLPRGILLWRAMLHWMGGAGFLITALSILPLLQISGMQLFRSRAVEVEKITPHASQMAVYVCIIYAGLTLICALMLSYAGMPVFDAICHAMGAISTGGFSTHDMSAEYFHNGLISMTLMIFMLFGALPFALYVRLFKGDSHTLSRDTQVRTFFAVLGLLIMLMAVYLFIIKQQSFFESVRHAAFLSVSMLTTTGFSSGDYKLWGPFITGLVFIAMFIGGCSGSAAGGIKVFRLKILWVTVQQQMRKLVTPNGVFQVQYNGNTIDPGVQAAVASLLFVSIASWAMVGVLLQLTGVDFGPAFFSSVAAISNTGTGALLADGTAYSGQEAPTLWVLSAAMLIGRLEFLTLMVVLMPRFWK